MRIWNFFAFYLRCFVKKNLPVSHLAIDGAQSTYWHNIGVLNLQRAGFDFFELIEGISEIELPKLLEQKRSYDFVFIDGWHTFDHTLLDFFYCYRMLNLNGVILIDDTQLPAVSKFIKYISNYPSLKFLDSFSTHNGDKQIVAFKKINQDNRDWDWFCDF